MSLSRRDLLQSAAVGAAALAIPGSLLAQVPKPTRAPRGAFRVCFFTDAHVPVPAAGDAAKFRQQERVRKAFDLANRYQPKLFVFGGDNVMAVDQGNSEENANIQFNNWKSLLSEKVRVPTAHVIGNHDIWYPKEGAPADRKALAKAAFGMPNRYYKVTLGGWNFFLLDVFHPNKATEVDAEQLAWLDGELAKTNLPSCVVTHAPILSVTAQVEAGAIGGQRKMRDLFLKHEPMRLALSGHMHAIDRCEHERMTYLCGGAVSGAWWGGNYLDTPPAFLILDLFPDGRIQREIVYWETPLGAPSAVGS